MEYGLIGEKLGHSWSKEIHEALGMYTYELKEIPKESLQDFILSKDYKGLNVTIPYKEQVIPFLDYIDEGASAIGAVNTIVNREGKLYGYNTDFYGMKSLLEETGYSFKEKKLLILGTGGTSKTAHAVLTALGATDIKFVSRSKKDNTITYDEAYSTCMDADFIINTTPSGMFPNIDAKAIDLSKFNKLFGIMDVIYNPSRTKLMLQAESLGIKAYGGLKMLVYQAMKAAELFKDITVDKKTSDKIYRKIRKKNENIVLIGMPGAGKTTVGKKIAAELSMDLIDTDACIVEKEGMEITDIFATKGEKYFRDIEEETVKECALKKNVVISTGGGAVLRQSSVDTLKAYGRLCFIKRDLYNLVPTDDRPLANNNEKMKKLYEERLPIYEKCADFTLNGNQPLSSEVKELLRYINEH